MCRHAHRALSLLSRTKSNIKMCEDDACSVSPRTVIARTRCTFVLYIYINLRCRDMLRCRGWWSDFVLLFSFPAAVVCNVSHAATYRALLSIILQYFILLSYIRWFSLTRKNVGTLVIHCTFLCADSRESRRWTSVIAETSILPRVIYRYISFI